MAFVTPLPLPHALSPSPRRGAVSANRSRSAHFSSSNLHHRTRHVCMTTPNPTPPSPSIASKSPSAPLPLATFLTEAAVLGTLRFVCVSTSGAVLESIGRLDYPFKQTPTPRGTLLTIATPDQTFEVHINLSKAKCVTLTSQKAKIGDHDIHVMRILDENEAILISIMLMWDPSTGPGHYLHGAVDCFESLKRKYGPKLPLLQE